MRIRKALQEFKRKVKKLYGPKLKVVILCGSWVGGDETDIGLLKCQ